MLAQVGLEGAGRTAIRKYSKGMMQRLGLAQALLHDPELAILDEPMSGLDPLGRMEVRALIRELKSAGKTVFFSSHIISDVEALCDRVVMVHKGRKVAEGAVDELMGSETLSVELVFHPVPPAEWLSGSGLPPGEGGVQGNTFVLMAKDYEEANRRIEAFRRVGSLVRSCIPIKRRLEDIYVREVAGQEADDALRSSYKRDESGRVGPESAGKRGE
jgi:ABC-2 type transport system ATP-binding protein